MSALSATCIRSSFSSGVDMVEPLIPGFYWATRRSDGGRTVVQIVAGNPPSNQYVQVIGNLIVPSLDRFAEYFTLGEPISDGE